MFKLLKSFFATKQTDLIVSLKKDHQKLLEIYNQLDKLVEQNEFTKAYKSFKEFILEYNKHILIEDTKLYKQLKELYENQPQILEAITIIENDMNSITKCIHNFEKTFKEITQENKQAFLEELHIIGNVLTQRINLEEERLYPLHNENDR
jgi:tetratricopeptide (TPR) repeat protein